MDYFPIFINLKQQPCLIVGAGEVAARKISLLIRAEAAITVIAPEISDAVIALQNSQLLTVIKKNVCGNGFAKFSLSCFCNG